MQHSQENGNTTSGVLAAGTWYGADQWTSGWNMGTATSRVIGIAPDPTAPFQSRAVNIYSAVGGALAATSYHHGFYQSIEGSRIADLRLGTANAVPMVLRFWASCAPAVTLVAQIANADASRKYLKLYNAVPAWTEFIIPIPPETTGTWPTDNTKAMQIFFGLSYGTNFTGGAQGVWRSDAASIHAPTGMGNFFATVPASFSFTNVGLYADPQATGVPPPWQTPDYASELRACMRYWEQLPTAGHIWSGSTVSGATYWRGSSFMEQKRAIPALSATNNNSNGFPATATLNASFTTVQESRAANATLNNAIFQSIITANARM
jgi:hypothetical protein